VILNKGLFFSDGHAKKGILKSAQQEGKFFKGGPRSNWEGHMSYCPRASGEPPSETRGCETGGGSLAAWCRQERARFGNGKEGGTGLLPLRSFGPGDEVLTRSKNAGWKQKRLACWIKA